MTNHEKQQIQEMRSAGAGCVRIAEELGLSVNSVKSFCRRHGLERNLALYTTPAVAPIVQTDSVPEPVPIVITAPCEQCGAPVTQVPARKKKRFCSDACRMAWWAAHRNDAGQPHARTFTCACCGNTFTIYGVPERTYCSKSCAARSRRREAAHD